MKPKDLAKVLMTKRERPAVFESTPARRFVDAAYGSKKVDEELVSSRAATDAFDPASGRNGCRQGGDGGVYESMPCPSLADVLHTAGEDHVKQAVEVIRAVTDQGGGGGGVGSSVPVASATVIEDCPWQSLATAGHASHRAQPSGSGGAGGGKLPSQLLPRRGSRLTSCTTVFENSPASSSADVVAGSSSKSHAEMAKALIHEAGAALEEEPSPEGSAARAARETARRASEARDLILAAALDACRTQTQEIAASAGIFENNPAPSSADVSHGMLLSYVETARASIETALAWHCDQ